MNDNKKFCILPWIHAHVLPDGNVLPCCAVEVGSVTLGSVKEKSLESIWNDEPFREMRLRMLNNKSVAACKVCYLAESYGGTSLRMKSNQDFSHHLDLQDKTNLDGSLEDFKLRYYDVRFSNLCNLHCRMCCPELSSSIAVDVAKAQCLSTPKPLNVYDSKEMFLKEFSPHVPYLEEIYFAGGEPLLIDAHYWALEELLKQGKNNIKLRYNTNFTVLGKGNWHAPDLWKEFTRIEIGASLDDEGQRAEYIRQGTKWNKVLANREILHNQSPHVDFRIASTVGLMNLLHYPEFIRKCVKVEMIRPDGFFINNLMFPEYFSSQVLPEKWKAIARNDYSSLINEMRLLGSPEWVLQNLISAQRFMDDADKSYLLKDFFQETSRLDKFFGKKFSDVFPEYEGLTTFNKG